MKDWEPIADFKTLRLRAQLMAMIRQFFADKNVLEVETPILSQAGNTDASIESFCVQFNNHKSMGSGLRWLRSSPEFALKRMVAAGIGDCYELGRVFRNGESGKRHNPEFTMLEWYRVGCNHSQLMDETAELVRAAMHLAGKKATVRDISFRQLYQDRFGFDPLTVHESELRSPLAVFDIDPTGLTRDDWLDLLMTHLIQPSIPANRILMVYDYPASQCALAKLRPDDVAVAERFEVYVGSSEVANGYHELTDATEQRERFGKDLAKRQKRAQIQVPVDERLLAALTKMPDCAGVALGVDRLLMAMLGSNRIQEVIAFPFDRA